MKNCRDFPCKRYRQWVVLTSMRGVIASCIWSILTICNAETRKVCSALSQVGGDASRDTLPRCRLFGRRPPVWLSPVPLFVVLLASGSWSTNAQAAEPTAGRTAKGARQSARFWRGIPERLWALLTSRGFQQHPREWSILRLSARCACRNLSVVVAGVVMPDRTELGGDRATLVKPTTPTTRQMRCEIPGKRTGPAGAH